MQLTLQKIIKAEIGQRSSKDRRFKVHIIIASYRGEDGYEYRKRFEAKKPPEVPLTGTHQDLNSKKIQY